MDNNQTQRNQNATRKSKNPLSNYFNNKIALVLVVAVLALVVFFVFFNGKSQGKYLDKSKIQAVFLNTGQVYFGNIIAINKDSVVLDNIFYLQTTTASGNTSTNVNLIKLGCEIHAPQDRMVINQSEVTFWENLSPNGKVVTAVTNYQKSNPKGQNCSDQGSSGKAGSTNPQNSNGN